MDEMDHIQQYEIERMNDARKEHDILMVDMKMVTGEFCCEDCGRELPFITKARLKQPMILCGECFDYHKHTRKFSKMKDDYE